MPEARERYALTAWVYGRALGAVFFAAFVSLGSQLPGLVGSRGILPAAEQLASIYREAGTDAYWLTPTLAWWGAGDLALLLISVLGTVGASCLSAGVLPGPALFLCLTSYVSLVNVGGPFTHFQWDVLLLEAGFCSLPLVPWVLVHRPRNAREPAKLGLLLLRLLSAKLMFLSGWVKLASNDPTWAELTALTYHYETQPLPGPLSYLLHHLSPWVHRASAVLTFGVELGLPALALVPHWAVRRAAGFGFVGLMIVILLTGNYGFFNLLAIALALPLFDDALLGRVFRGLPVAARAETGTRAARVEALLGTPLGVVLAALLVLGFTLAAPGAHGLRIGLTMALGAVAARFAFTGYEAVRPRRAPRGRIREKKARAVLFRSILPSVRHAFAQTLAGVLMVGCAVPFARRIGVGDRRFWDEALADLSGLHAFNAYGLFAVMTTHRPEVILEGTRDGRLWHEYELPYKPGALDRAPPFLLGHMPRLDWQLWFAALGGPRRQPWVARLMQRLVEGEPSVLRLFSHNPFEDAPPKAVRALVYEYRFTQVPERAMTGNWWLRERPRLFSGPTHAAAAEP